MEGRNNSCGQGIVLYSFSVYVCVCPFVCVSVYLYVCMSASKKLLEVVILWLTVYVNDFTFLCSDTRIARRHKKDFVSDLCKEIEENNRMGKTRGLFKKIRNTKGTFHGKMGSIKDRNGMDLTEAEDIKKRWLEYTE